MAGIVDVKKISQDVSALDTTVKAVQSDLTTHTSNDDIHLSSQQKSDISMIADLAVALGSKVESSAFEAKTKEIEAAIAERVPAKTFNDTIAGLDDKYAPLAHVSNTSRHFSGDEKVNLNAILAN